MRALCTAAARLWLLTGESTLADVVRNRVAAIRNHPERGDTLGTIVMVVGMAVLAGTVLAVIMAVAQGWLAKIPR